MNYIWIFIGGGLGSVARFEMGRQITKVTGTAFPFATIAINFISCLILGFLAGLLTRKEMASPVAVLFIGMGFCGGFSTFSTFTAETMELLKAGNFVYAGANVIVSVAICLLSFWGGYVMAKFF